jgi:hypothetical protein
VWETTACIPVCQKCIENTSWRLRRNGMSARSEERTTTVIMMRYDRNSGDFRISSAIELQFSIHG